MSSDFLGLHFPGGRLAPEHWQALAVLAGESADGEIQVSGRSGVRVRTGSPEQLADRAREAGLVPRSTQDGDEAIVASPLAGRLRGRQDISDLPEQLDRALLTRQGRPAGSPGLLFGIDDGSGDVLRHRPDLGLQLSDVEPGRGEVVVAGTKTGRCASVTDLPLVLADLAGVAVATEGGIAPDGAGHREVLNVLATDSRTASESLTAANPPTEAPPVGWVDAHDGTVSLLAVTASGVVSGRLAEFIAVIDRPTTVSADKVIGVHGLTEGIAEQVVRVLAPMGMIFDAASEWARAVPIRSRET